MALERELAGIEPRREDREALAPEDRGVPTALPDRDRRLAHEERMIALAETLAANLLASREDARGARSDAERRLAEIADGLARTLETARSVEVRIASLKAEIEVGDALNAEYLAEIADLKAYVGHLEHTIAAIKQDNAARPSGPAAAPPALSAVYAELVRHRETRVQRLFGTFRRDVLWDHVAPAFAPLRDYTGRHLRSGRHRLALSEDLCTIDYREYAMPHACRRLSRICLAVNPLAPSAGEVGVEVVGADHVVLAQETMPLAGVSDGAPAAFSLALGPLARGWRLRVFVRHATAPVTVYELVDPSVLRRRPRRLPFVSIE